MDRFDVNLGAPLPHDYIVPAGTSNLYVTIELIPLSTQFSTSEKYPQVILDTDEAGLRTAEGYGSVLVGGMVDRDGGEARAIVRRDHDFGCVGVRVVNQAAYDFTPAQDGRGENGQEFIELYGSGVDSGWQGVGQHLDSGLLTSDSRYTHLGTFPMSATPEDDAVTVTISGRQVTYEAGGAVLLEWPIPEDWEQAGIVVRLGYSSATATLLGDVGAAQMETPQRQLRQFAEISHASRSNIDLTVHTLTGSKIEFDLEDLVDDFDPASFTIANLKERYQDREGVPLDLQNFYVCEESNPMAKYEDESYKTDPPLADEATLGECGLENACHLVIILQRPSPPTL